MKFLHRAALVALLLAVSVGCDQATKRIATAALAQHPGYSFLGDTVRLVYAENAGAFLSLGGSLPAAARFLLLTVAVGLVLLFILGYAFFAKKLDALEVAGYACIAGGGISNWVDRALNDGRVVDFMNLGIGPVRTGIFNVADLVLIAGIVILLYAGRRRERKAAA
jgi:signal peptidase II